MTYFRISTHQVSKGLINQTAQKIGKGERGKESKKSGRKGEE